MITTTLPLSIVAHIVRTQATHTLDCSSHQVHLFSNNNKHSLRIEALQVLENKQGDTVLKCSFPCKRAPIVLKEDDHYRYSFRILDELPTENTILNAVPTVDLFPENKLGLTKAIPVGTSYTCTREETRQLLQLAIPDVATSVLQRFPLCVTFHTRLIWHAISNQHPRYAKRYSLAGPNATPPSINAGRLRLDAPEARNCDLTPFRTRIILAAVFPLLRHLCAWRASTTGANHSFSDTDFHRILQDYEGKNPLWALPLLRSTDIVAAASPTIELNMENYLPKDPVGPPCTEETIATIAQHISSAISQEQALALTC